jgi:hypothetical protein
MRPRILEDGEPQYEEMTKSMKMLKRRNNILLLLLFFIVIISLFQNLGKEPQTNNNGLVQANNGL